MARSINRLTAKAVTTAKAPGLYGDGAGLYLQVSNVTGTGPTKAWLFRFMLDGRARKMGLGSARDFTLAEARDRARAARQLLADGVDPIESRLAKRDASRREDVERLTFKAAAEKFLSVHASGWRNAKHRQQWANTLATYAYPTLGSRPVRAVDDALINAALAEVWRKVPETASRVRQRIGRVVAWVKSGMPLPVASVARRVKHHAALSWSEIPSFMAELRGRNSISGRALEFVVLTACRTGEALGAKWSEVDLKGATWTVPAERMKAGKRHVVPLSDRAVELLRQLPREAHRDGFIFPGAKARAPLSNMALLQQLRGLRPNLTTHGFRSTFRDWCAEATNYPRDVAEMALAHTIPDRVEAAYRRGDLIAKRRRLMADWAAYCARKPTDAANVTQLRTRA